MMDTGCRRMYAVRFEVEAVAATGGRGCQPAGAVAYAA